MRKMSLVTKGSGMLLALLLAACSSTDRQLDEKIKAEPPVKNRAELQSEASGLVKESTTLSEDQKSRLIAVEKEIRMKLDLLNEESWKLRSLLIKDMLGSEKFDSGEVDAIKDRLRKVEDKRLGIMFNTIDKANEIIGRVDFRRKDVFFFQLLNQYPPRGMD